MAFTAAYEKALKSCDETIFYFSGAYDAFTEQYGKFSAQMDAMDTLRVTDVTFHARIHFSDYDAGEDPSFRLTLANTGERLKIGCDTHIEWRWRELDELTQPERWPRDGTHNVSEWHPHAGWTRCTATYGWLPSILEYLLMDPALREKKSFIYPPGQWVEKVKGLLNIKQ